MMVHVALLFLTFIFQNVVSEASLISAENDNFGPSNPYKVREKRQLARALGSVYKFVSENSCRGGSKCYKQLGCFQCRYGYHVEPPKKINPRFYFYAPQEDVRILDFFGNLDASIDNMRFKKIRGTQGDLWVIIHGFNPGPWPIPWTIRQADALVAKGHNVLLVNWVSGVAYPNYLQGASNARLTAAAVARVLELIEQRKGINRRQMNVVGFSLGSHTAGWVGERVRGLRRIIGLDPAGPLFTGADAVHRLDPTDAYYVQCIHTNGNKFLPGGGLGTLQPFGHVDFYVNGGKLQPGCPKPEKLSLIKDLEKLITEVCHHFVAPDIFTESIKQFGKGSHICKYHAYQCSDGEEWDSGRCFNCPSQGCFPVGYAAAVLRNVTLRGKLYFSTVDKEQCGNQFLIVLQPGSHVQGDIEVGLKDAQSDAYSSKFINRNTQDPDSLITVNIAAPFSKPSEVLVYYEKSGPALLGLLGGSGPEQWRLKGVTVLTGDKRRYDSLQPEVIANGATTAIQLVTVP